MANRKQRSDSITQHGEWKRGSLPYPPDHVNLQESAKPFWWSIIAAKAPDAWTAPDLEQAAELARTKADLERLRGQIAETGDLTPDGEKIHPLRKLEETLVARSIRLSRALQVHALATVGQSGDQRQRNQDWRDTAGAGSDDDLIPGGRH
ncbi:TerS protein [Halovibrio salipaludis]|uniref:TerS protein n=1 Tax=Halovibrio salipaludis TaxID=2032626 RepID=A0A2A2F660_9GAMM|nr:TerS protein [Halovibrio salipaludis]PAU81061.1 TerS protein [Halovibrio salipaludis]